MIEYAPYLVLLGRILLGGYFITNGIRHFTQASGMAGYTASKGVPMARAAVLLTGAMMLLGGLGVLLGAFVGYAVLLLVLFLVPVTFLMHAYWKADEASRMMEQIQFMKNLALLGGVLMLLAIPTPWAMSLGW